MMDFVSRPHELPKPVLLPTVVSKIDYPLNVPLHISGQNRVFCWSPEVIVKEYIGKVEFGVLLPVSWGQYMYVAINELEALSKWMGIDYNRFYTYTFGTVLQRSNNLQGASIAIYPVNDGEDAIDIENRLKILVQRSVLLKCLIHIYDVDRSPDKHLDKIMASNVHKPCIDATLLHSEPSSYGFRFITINKKYKDKMTREVEYHKNLFPLLPQNCKINLQWPHQVFGYIELNKLEPIQNELSFSNIDANDKLMLSCINKKPKIDASLEEPNHALFIFGRVLVDHKVFVRMRHWSSSYALPSRVILGPTTLESDLAFIMCNMARVSNGDFVLDPFCGTGSILIGAHVLGGIGVGIDFDIRVIKGYSIGQLNMSYANKKWVPRGESQTDRNSRSDINVNFETYRLPIPNITRMDITKLLLRNAPIFDSIVTDPPYGIRAPSRSIDKVARGKRTTSTELVDWEVMYKHLLHVASILLVPHGRLVFLLPSSHEQYAIRLNKIKNWTQEYNMEMENPIFQPLQSEMGRFIISVYKK